MTVQLSGSSRESLATVRAALDLAIAKGDRVALDTLVGDLYSVLGALHSSGSLRRALTDPARDAASKTKLIHDLFGAVISAPAMELVERFAGLRWSAPSDIADAVERIAIEALSAFAESVNELDRLEAELFDFGRFLVRQPDFRSALDDARSTEQAKFALVRSLFADSFAQSTIRVLELIIGHRRGRNIERVLSFYSTAIAARKERLIAKVKTAMPLSPMQQSRLADLLAQTLGRQVRVNVEVDSSIVGGVSIQVGDELIDGTVLARLSQVRRTIVGRQALVSN